MKVTLEKIEIVLSSQWDVDITPEAAHLVLPEIQEFAWNAEKEYLTLNQWQRRHSDLVEVETVEKEQRKFIAIYVFFRKLIGQTCYFDENDKFVASEFYQKYGKILGVEHLPKKQWKTIEEVPLPVPKPRKRKSKLNEPASENLIRLNQFLLSSGCLPAVTDKFQSQLSIIADSGINLKKIDICVNQEQTIFSFEKGTKSLSVDLNPGRCAIRLYDNFRCNEKIYCHRDRGIADILVL